MPWKRPLMKRTGLWRGNWRRHGTSVTLQMVKSSRRDTAAEAWAAQVCEEAVQNTKEVFEEKRTNYTLVELDDELQAYPSEASS